MTFRRKSVRRFRVIPGDAEWAKKICRANVCIKCGRRGVTHAHHIIPRRYSSFRHDERNGIPLCFSCHVGAPDAAHNSPTEFRRWLWQTQAARMKALDEECPQAWLRRGMRW